MLNQEKTSLRSCFKDIAIFDKPTTKLVQIRLRQKQCCDQADLTSDMVTVKTLANHKKYQHKYLQVKAQAIVL